MYDEYECFDISKATVDDLQKIADISEWFLSRIEEIYDGRIEEMWFNYNDGTFRLKTSYEDFCMGCHMGTKYNEYKIPKDIFFSSYSIGHWLAEQDELKQEAEEKRKKRRAAAAKIARKKKAILDKERKERNERELYEQLKSKYEGENYV